MGAERYTPPGWYGQTSTTGAGLKLGAFAAGAAAAGAVTPAVGTTTALGLIAGCQLVAAGFGVTLERRPLHRTTSAEKDDVDDIT